MMTWKARSSPLSALLTAMIGWNGLVTLVALLLGAGGAPWGLFAVASATALAQAAVLWPLYLLRLRLDGRAVARGASGGALSGAVLFAPWALRLGVLATHPATWIVAAALAGAAVGGFIAYFFADDARLISLGEPVDRGRDAHWLEPFAFGAGVFASVCLPRSLDAAVYTTIVGAVVGVVAAGVSHYTPDVWNSSARGFLAFCAFGAVLGGGAAFLLRHQPASLAAGPTAGALTLLVTLLRGKVLAAREAGASSPTSS
jgi:hypothetical protein